MILVCWKSEAVCEKTVGEMNVSMSHILSEAYTVKDMLKYSSRLILSITIQKRCNLCILNSIIVHMENIQIIQAPFSLILL